MSQKGEVSHEDYIHDSSVCRLLFPATAEIGVELYSESRQAHKRARKVC